MLVQYLFDFCHHQLKKHFDVLKNGGRGWVICFLLKLHVGLISYQSVARLITKQVLLLLILHVFFHTRHTGLYNTYVSVSYVYKINTVLQDFIIITQVCLSLCSIYYLNHLRSNLSYVTFQGNSEICSQ